MCMLDHLCYTSGYYMDNVTTSFKHRRQHYAIHIVGEQKLLRVLGIGQTDERFALKISSPGTSSFDRQILSIVGLSLTTTWLEKLAAASRYAPGVGIFG